jgi:hypothetical protein
VLVQETPKAKRVSKLVGSSFKAFKKQGTDF